MTHPASIDADLMHHPRKYHPSLFVNRETELQTIAQKMHQAQVESLVVEPIVNFWGVKGIGKTWILHHLRYLYSYHAELPTVSSNERPPFALLYTAPDASTAFSLGAAARTLADELLSQLSSELDAGELERLVQARDSASIDVLMKALLILSQRFVPLLLLDNAEKVSQADWEKLELSLIEPLVSTGHAVVVIAGRRQVPRWHRFEVRRRVMAPEKSRVQPFDQQSVRKQLEQAEYQIPVDLFFPYTAGNPLLADTIAQHIVAWTKDVDDTEINQGWFGRHQDMIVRVLWASEEQLLENVPSRLRCILDMVSPLRFYRLEALRFMLAKSGTKPEEHTEGYYLNILRALDQQTEVVWWDHEHRAYVTSQVVRQLMNRRRLLEDQEDYARRHRDAIAMYWDWIREYPEASEDFIVEVWFHLASLYLAEGNTDHLGLEVKKVLRFAHKHLNSDRFMILPEQLAGDYELLELLPKGLYNELLEDLEQLLNGRSAAATVKLNKANWPGRRLDRMTEPPITPESSTDVFAPRTPHIIGRRQYIDDIRRAIADDTGRSHVLYFVGLGGIGKTRLLEEVAVIQKEWSGKPFRFTGIIDLYYTKYHSPGGLRQAIADGLDPDNHYFQGYRSLRAEWERKRREGMISPELEEIRRQFDGLFQQEYAALAEKQRLVLCFDTLELIQYESDAVQRICQIQDMDTVIKNWILEQVKRFPNTATLFAGRPRPITQADFQQSFTEAGCLFTLVELKAFTKGDTHKYLEAMSTRRRELGAILTPEMQERIFYITQGRPIYLTLLIDLLLHGQALGQIIPRDPSQNVDHELVGKHLVEHLLNLPNPFDQMIYFLMHAQKGLDVGLLLYLAGDLWSEDQILENMAHMREFAFVKTRSDTAQLFLHDEVYGLCDLYFHNDPRFGHEYESIARYYRQRLKSAASSQEREELTVTLIYYELQVDAHIGFLHWYTRWDEDAINSHEVSLDMRLRDEVLRFMERYTGHASPFYDPRIVQQVDHAVIDRDSAVRWVKRYVARGDFEKAQWVAENLYRSTEPVFNWNEVNDPLYKAALLSAWGEVLVHTSAPEEKARTLLEQAIQFLGDDQRWSDDQRWLRARILGRTHNYLGYLYRIRGRYGPALDQYKRALPYFNAADIQDERANTLNNLAYLLALLGRVNSALLHIKQALEIRQGIGHKYQLALSHNTRGIIHTLHDHPEWGERECREALYIFEDLQEPRGIGLTCLGLGFALRRRGDQWKVDVYPLNEAAKDFQEAVQYFERAVNIFSTQVSEPVRLWEAYNELGSLYCDWGFLTWERRISNKVALEQYERSINYQREALKIAQERELQSQTLDSLDDLAQVIGDRSFLLLRMRKLKKARQSRVEAESLLDQIWRMVPMPFHLTPGQGFRQEAEAGEIYWRVLGKAHQWWGRWAFRDLQIGVVPDQKREKMFQEATRNLILAAAYFQRFWPASFALEQALGIFGDSQQMAGVSSDWTREQVRAVATEYRINLDIVEQAVSDMLGL